MTDPVIDDVKTLLDKEKGDERILKQICRACENNEVISNYERNYVRTLAEKYLGRTPEVEEKQHVEEKSISVIIGVSLSGVSYIESDDSQIPIDSSSTLSIQTDLSTYQKGDIISISGTSNTSGKINLSIENQDGQLVWSEQISVKSNGRFSTLAIAGGDGWDKSGTFTLKVENNLETE